MITILCYRRCSTCRKLEKTLEEKNIAYAYREIDKDVPAAEELKDWHRASGLPLKRFFNTSGIKYREMGLAKRLPDLSEEEQYRLLATDGLLIKRPILLENGRVHVGKDAVTWAEEQDAPEAEG